MARQLFIRWTGLIIITAWVAGCGSTPKDDGPHPVWPAPPQTARVVHVKNLRTVEDLGKPSVFDQLGQAITGTPQQGMVRPSSVAVHGDHLIVSDQEMQGVHVFRFGRAKAAFVSEIDDGHLISPVGVAAWDGEFAVADSARKKVFVFNYRGDLQRSIDRPEGFGRPAGLAYDPASDRLYVIDTLRGQLCVFDKDGRFIRAFGSIGQDVGQFNFPSHVHVDREGRIYITDSLNFRVQVFDRQFKYLFEIGRHGDASGHFGVPKGVSTDSQGHVYVVDSYFGAVQVFDRSGRLLLSIGKIGPASGEFQVPTGIAIDATDRIFICDSHNRRVQVLQYTGADQE